MFCACRHPRFLFRCQTNTTIVLNVPIVVKGGSVTSSHGIYEYDTKCIGELMGNLQYMIDVDASDCAVDADKVREMAVAGIQFVHNTTGAQLHTALVSMVEADQLKLTDLIDMATGDVRLDHLLKKVWGWFDGECPGDQYFLEQQKVRLMLSLNVLLQDYSAHTNDPETIREVTEIRLLQMAHFCGGPKYVLIIREALRERTTGSLDVAERAFFEMLKYDTW